MATTPTPNDANGHIREPDVPYEEDIMKLARFGEIKLIQNLFDSGKYDASYKDEQGVTPLHWAAIKNHHALCHFLLQAGADVNAKGGDIDSTPLLWAARENHYYIVDLLLEHGGDPLKTDAQGFNLIHNVTMDGNTYQLLLVLMQDVPVDATDSHGHTSLMWSAYKGMPECTDLLLRFGADVGARDENGFTALHWSLVKGNVSCIQKLIERGSDRSATTNDGKSPDTCAKEMNSVRQYHKALSDCGLTPDGSSKPFPLSSLISDRRKFFSRMYFLWPFIEIFALIFIISGFPIFVGGPLAAVTLMSLQWIAFTSLRYAPPDMSSINHTGFVSGIFAGSLFWVGIRYLQKILPYTFWTIPFQNLLFMILYGLCTHFYVTAMIEDPGYIYKSTNREEQRSVVSDLIKKRIFDYPHFCLHCMIRKPLRSKHCRKCGRCVAKHDHHCPWINSCVGNNNHRHFFYYITAMEIGVSLLGWISVQYIKLLPMPTETKCNVVSDEWCKFYNRDPFTVLLTVWVCLQLTWVTMLLFVQLTQISRAQTTLENMRGHQQLEGASGVLTAAAVAGTTSLDDAELDARGLGPRQDGATVGAVSKPKEGCWEQWKKLLGLDTFLATAMYGSRAQEVQERNAANPYNRGCITNFQDFFCDSAPQFGHRNNGDAMLGREKVNYTTLYEPPPRYSMRAAPRGEAGGAYSSVATDDNV